MKRKQAAKTIMFQWLLVHNATSIGIRQERMGYVSCCPMCNFDTETQNHCLWDCYVASYTIYVSANQNFHVLLDQARYQGYRAQVLIKWDLLSYTTMRYIWKLY